MKPVTRFTSECNCCAKLLSEYIAASNEIVESTEHLHSSELPSARQLASALIDNALSRKNLARKQLFTHKARRH